MKFTKIAAAAIGTVILSFIAAGCAENKEDAQKPEKNIPSASVNSDYQAITIDGNTVNMDDGTIYRGLGGQSAPIIPLGFCWIIKRKTLMLTGKS